MITHGTKLVLLWLAVGLTVAAGCKQRQTATPRPSGDADEQLLTSQNQRPQVKVATVGANDVTDEVEVAGTVEGYESAQIMSKVDGYVEEVNVNIGDHVEDGQVLARLDLPEILAEVNRRERLVQQSEAMVRSEMADVDLAKARKAEYQAKLSIRQSERKRVTRLVGLGSLNEQQLDEAIFGVEEAQAMLRRADAEIVAAEAHVARSEAEREVARAELEKTTSMARYGVITAPFNGLVTERMIDSGAYVRPPSDSGTPLFKMTRVDKVRIVLFLPLDDGGKLDVGDVVEIRQVESIPGFQIKADSQAAPHISRVAKSYNRDSRMMRAEVDVDNVALKEATGRELVPGDYLRVAVRLEGFVDTLKVPSAAIGSDDDGVDFVMVVEANGLCRQQAVNVLHRGDGQAVIAPDDLAVGDRVVVSDLSEVKDRMNLASDQISSSE